MDISLLRLYLEIPRNFNHYGNANRHFIGYGNANRHFIGYGNVNGISTVTAMYMECQPLWQCLEISNVTAMSRHFKRYGNV